MVTVFSLFLVKFTDFGFGSPIGAKKTKDFYHFPTISAPFFLNHILAFSVLQIILCPYSRT